MRRRDIDRIDSEEVEFQRRCFSLPRALAALAILGMHVNKSDYEYRGVAADSVMCDMEITCKCESSTSVSLSGISFIRED